MDLDNIAGKDDNSINVGGHTGRIRISRISEMTTIQKKKELDDPTPPTTPEELVEITTNHAWAVGKGAAECYITRDEGMTELDINEVPDTNGVEAKYTGSIPGAASTAHGILTLMNNSRVIVWVELFSGEWIQIGSKRAPAELKYKWSSGKNKGTARKFSLTIIGFETTIQYYKGTFTLI
jgi:hypothetical protein